MAPDEPLPSSPAAPAPLAQDWSPSLPEREARHWRRLRAWIALRTRGAAPVLLALSGPFAASLLAFAVASAFTFDQAAGLVVFTYLFGAAPSLLALAFPDRPRASAAAAAAIAVVLGVALSVAGYALGELFFEPQGLMREMVRITHLFCAPPLFALASRCLFRRR